MGKIEENLSDLLNIILFQKLFYNLSKIILHYNNIRHYLLLYFKKNLPILKILFLIIISVLIFIIIKYMIIIVYNKT